MGSFPSYIAMAMGATVIEKHYTVDKTLGMSADHWLSVDPGELKDIVDNVRRIEILQGSKDKVVFNSERETRKYDKRSIVSKRNIKEGERITQDMLTYKRPGTGIEPKYVERLLAKVAKENIKADTTLQWEMFERS
jgi:sialic acid synthase SpsE